jgi:hypothetical protein
MNAQRVKKGAAQVKWEAGLPLTGDDVREFMGDKADELIHVEEVKSIGRAIRRDRSYGACVMGNGETSFQRLCDWCNEPRGSMWIIRPEVWNSVIPNKKRQDDICLGCWHKKVTQ